MDETAWGPDEWEGFIWGRESAPFLDFPLEQIQADLKLRIHQNLSGTGEESAEGLGSSDGLHTTVWEAAIALYLFAEREDKARPGCWRGLRVLELGAGTGLVGLTFAAFGAHVTLTELPVALPLLNFNLRHNSASLAGSAHACVLSWGDHVPMEKYGVFDMVVGADIVYAEPLFEPLLATLNQVCAPETVVYLSRLQRGTDPAKTERFYQGLRDFGFTTKRILVGGGRYRPNDTASIPEDPALSAAFRTLTDQTLPFELVRATRSAQSDEL